MDRWSIVTTLNYLPHDVEVEIVLAKTMLKASVLALPNAYFISRSPSVGWNPGRPVPYCSDSLD
jgi:hypothetical protein